MRNNDCEEEQIVETVAPTAIFSGNAKKKQFIQLIVCVVLENGCFRKRVTSREFCKT